jgi:hypothetical protein
MLAAPLASDLTARPTSRPLPTSSLASWARHHRLRHDDAGTLPPATPRLRASLGIGSRRALGESPVEHPATLTTDICAGRLPGGVEGVVAHRSHVAEDRCQRGGREWAAWTATVVLVNLGCAGRAASAPASPGCEVELEDGYLCVSAGRELTEPAELDELCRTAATIARIVRATASGRRWTRQQRRSPRHALA